ncbi:hypothetical protein RvY_13940 [Ramazzottius varieornatus]|uniref:Uncharacterized protein n=1 Tax=Ramazzottius varieornatus TaxID=947166 RepID=A0A1D1VPN6_RAMVA|nr:hypothetical protein RvY_13940 [Ramazzottius varieornatus]
MSQRLEYWNQKFRMRRKGCFSERQSCCAGPVPDVMCLRSITLPLVSKRERQYDVFSLSWSNPLYPREPLVKMSGSAQVVRPENRYAHVPPYLTYSNITIHYMRPLQPCGLSSVQE